jgi:hypothetical protein
VIGGYAVALPGHPRYTKDIDVRLDRNEDNAACMVRALEGFGFGSSAFRRRTFLVEDQIIQLGYPPNRMDVLTTLPGVDFDACYPSRVEVMIDDLPSPS